MKIDSIKTYPVGYSSQKFRLKHSSEHKSEHNEGMLNDNESVNRGYYSGSFTGKNEAAAEVFENLGNTFTDKIFRSGKFHDLLHVFEEKTVVASTLVALIVAGMARPATNLAMAGKEDREDSIYAASHAISSAVIGFIVSSIVMAPFDKAFRKIKENPEKYLTGLEELFDVKEIGKRKLEKSKPYKKISKVAQMIPDTLILGIPKAMLTIALIPPILKYVFHIEKGKHKHKTQEPQTDNVQYSKEFVKNPSCKAVKGGHK